tara:strand:+ start:1056 stop:1346 length:291 start_codon:yes stop_codon:yes gene_type:complete
MIVRIVKLSFHLENISAFKAIFESNKANIITQKGCMYLEVYQDVENPHIFFTYSKWGSETDLNTYRSSELFQGIWVETKKLFNAKPNAWSTKIINN